MRGRNSCVRTRGCEGRGEACENSADNNGYKKWGFVQISKRKVREEDQQIDGPTANKHSVCMSCMFGLSEQLQQVFRSHGIPSYHKPFNTIRS